MKRLILTLITALLMGSALWAQEDIFEKFADRKGVTTVYISKKMFSMMNGYNNGSINLNNIGSKISGLQILSCEDKTVIPEIRKEAARIKTDGYEVLMRIKEEGEHVTIYTKEGKEENQYILLADEPQEFTIIMLNGKLTLEELQGTIKR
ncbi:DUF4252 domain-containing protein [uncultured Bacteroides sp.]|uniref:DUF4252 domain-containing protein n=1 Tax=uncultured Bacteroides sp. TaxID=162156 RepID=UPI002631F157|nr:DUF4252 domain-containing protein [uncultured Bacteroides sp.]